MGNVNYTCAGRWFPPLDSRTVGLCINELHILAVEGTLTCVKCLIISILFFPFTYNGHFLQLNWLLTLKMMHVFCICWFIVVLKVSIWPFSLILIKVFALFWTAFLGTWFLFLSLFCFKEIRMVLISLDWHEKKYNILFWQLMFCPVFLGVVGLWWALARPNLATYIKALGASGLLWFGSELLLLQHALLTHAF